MKNRAGKNKLNGTLKIADIDSEKLSEGLECCSKNPQGIRSLPHFRALSEPVLADRIDAFMEDKLFALLFPGEGMTAVRAYQTRRSVRRLCTGTGRCYYR